MSGSGFFANWFVWRDAMVVGVVSAAALAYLGVWVVLRRVVWVPLALSEVSSAGVVFAVLASGWLGAAALDPAWLSLVAALLTAFFLARPRAAGASPVAVAYLIAGALVLILGSFVRQDLHDLEGILFGSAVLVEPVQVIYVGAAALLTLALHGLMFPQFLFVSFDPDAAGAAGLSVFRTDVLLFGSFALMLSVATRAIGALPAFGLMVLPALTGLRLGGSLRGAFLIAATSGVVSAALGYYLSFIGELPTGAVMVAVAGGIYVVTALGGGGLRRRRRRARATA
jgi:zinc transport system permease protein